MHRAHSSKYFAVNVLGILALLLSTVGMAITPASIYAAIPADHTNPPTSVTVVGSLQAALGCDGNWDPTCAATGMVDDADDDVWQHTATVPAGDWEYKAALNGSWDENYGAGAVAGGDNIALSLANGNEVKFYYDHKSHWVTDNQNSRIVTAPGSYQAALGCPGDWQPDCLRSWLQDPDGDEIYTFATDAIPAGDYEAKAAINEGWDESYGQDGGGDNIAFTVADGDTVTFRFDSATNTPTIAVESGGGGEDWASIAQPPTRNAFQNQVMYFVMPDRFADGDAANNQGGITGDRLDHGFDPTDKGFYHGGDMAGLVDKLDYLAGLGVTSIWMTPMFKNNPVQGSADDISAGYHGYWINDFTQTDPHFGANSELEALIDAAAAKGIDIFFDIITNHTADILDYEEGTYAYRSKADHPYKDADGAEFDDRDYVGGDTFPALDAETSFPYTPVFNNAGDENLKVPAWLNDPTVYHNRGNSSFSGENSLYGDFYGLDDLFTEQPTVVDGMIAIFEQWISDYGVAGFRIDTVKHVNVEFWEAFSAAIAEHATEVGRNDFFFFGEVFSGNEQLLSFYSTETDMPAVLDFKFQEQVRGYASAGGSATNLANMFNLDDVFTDADSNAYMMPTFLGNHDRGRFGHFLIADGSGNMSDDEMLARSKLAHAMMYFARGVPVIYYGDEQGFTGTGGDKDARQDMFPSQVAEYGDPTINSQIGVAGTPANDNFDATHPLYMALAEYAEVYQAHSALRNGAQIHRYAADGPGIYAFSRMDRGERLEYVISFNNADSEQTATFPVYDPGVEFTLVSGNGAPQSIESDADSMLILTVPALDFVIYSQILREEAPSLARKAATGISITQPASGAEIMLGSQNFDGNDVPDRMEIVAELDVEVSNIFAEVTFAVRESGTDEWTTIGVDDNPPYRVFYNPGDVGEGKQFDFVAVANDFFEESPYSGATVSDVTVVPKDYGSGGGSGYDHAVIHYLRSDGDYGDHTTGDYNDYWGMHLWGDALADGEGTEWTSPRPFVGETDYGRFAWVNLADSSKDVNFIVHRGDTKDGTDADRAFNPNRDGPEIWLKQDDGEFYTSQAAAQGYVTIHYQRDDMTYDDWGLHLWGDAIDDGVGTEWANPLPWDGIDDFGAYWNVPIKTDAAPVNFIIHKGDDKDPGPDQSLLPSEQAHGYVVSGVEALYKQQGDAENYVLIHYRRDVGDYGDYTSEDFNDFWGLHTWAAAADPGWTTPRKADGTDEFGVYFKVPLTDKEAELGYILHRGDEKDPGPNQAINFAKWGFEVWQLQGVDPENPYVRPILAGEAASGGDLALAKAHWVSEDTIAWNVEYNAGNTYSLHYAPAGGITLTGGAIAGGESIALTYDPAGLSDAVKAKFPHLADYAAFVIATDDLINVGDILKGQIAISCASDALVLDATGLQLPGALDDLYTYNGDLGIVWNGDIPTLRVWAPTAKSVKLHIFESSTSDPAMQVIDMTAGEKGTWSATGDASWKDKFYLYEIEVYVHSTGQVENNIVTDPYSISMAMNSLRSQIVDLNDTSLTPDGWAGLTKPALAAPEDISVYEMHMRDFSVHDATVPAEMQGTFKAFTVGDSNGMAHLKALGDAGLTHVHLLPAFDIATINEDKRAWQTPDIPADAAPDGTAQRDAVNAVADADAFNWGYDPFHYTVPEGSYSTNPDGSTRILEFREMVKAVNESGLRVVMDVVYNHTNSSGQDAKSVLDKVVPGYYHRLNADGAVETSTCCQNTATEHNMMEKLMVDSLVTWATAYKVDGFRFDLMGHHMKRNMEAVQIALAAVDPTIYIYGEGWDFGEVQGGQRGENATQLNMAGTGIGTFNDRLRDAVRGGGPFDEGDSISANQGFISGLYYDPIAMNSGSDTEKAEMLLSADQIRVGLAGNLADYEFVDHTGATVKGSEVDYNGSPTGYTQDPQEHIVYVSAHDNETLYDIAQFKLPADTTMADRLKVQNLGIDFTVLAQGVPFLHAGVDMLRSKSLDRDSYNSGDWFNKLDFTYADNNWGKGLPPHSNALEARLKELLVNDDLKPGQADMQTSVQHLRDMLAIRNSSRLFRLLTKEDVMQRLTFHNTGPDQQAGLVVMSVSDMVGSLPDVDNEHEMVVALFNVNDEEQQFTEPTMIGFDLELHPVQQGTGTFDVMTGTFMLAPRTTAVFMLDEDPTAIDDEEPVRLPDESSWIYLPVVSR